jgi:hypothetical protein
MNENGTMEDMQVIPDLENEIIDEQAAAPPKKGGCGCNKNKNMMPPMDYPAQTGFNWTRVAMIVGAIALVYFIFKKKGKIEVPKVEVPEVN